MEEENYFYDIKNEVEISLYENINGILDIIDHLISIENFDSYIKINSISYGEIHPRSYLFFIYFLVDKLSLFLSQLDDTGEFIYDYNLYRGHLSIYPYYVFCNESIRGRLTNKLYSTIDNVDVDDIQDLFLHLNNFSKDIKFLRIFISELNLTPNYFNIHHNVLQIFDRIDMPIDINLDITYTIHHFFDVNRYLNFFKNEKGNWIGSKGFFVGLIMMYEFILNIEPSNTSSIHIYKKLPFADFSQEKSGIFPLYAKLSSDDNDEISGVGNYYTNLNKFGVFYAYEKKLPEMVAFSQMLESLFDKHFVNKQGDKPFSIIKNQLKNFTNKIRQSQIETPYLDIPKLFDYNKI